MIGLSGGGWTTTLYAAIDPRVRLSFPVAGTLPDYLRLGRPGDKGDWEQFYPDLYKVANNWLLAGRRWGQGDFNFDQVTNATDLARISQNWQAELPPAATRVLTGATRTPTRTAVRLTVLT